MKIKLIYSILLIIILFPAPIFAQSVSYFFDETDPMTDRRELSVALEADVHGIGNYGIGFSCWEGHSPEHLPIMIVLSGIKFIIEDAIPITYRFDTALAETDTFAKRGNTIIKTSAQKLLERSLNSNKLLVRLRGEELMTFDLNEARENLQKFDSECQSILNHHDNTK